jgi:transcriptional regulator with XRE-family HTH domain
MADVPTRRKPLSRALGWRVRQLREAKRWTQEQLAEHADLDRSYIAGIEAGLRNPSIQSIWKVAKAFEVTLSVLFEGVP